MKFCSIRESCNSKSKRNKGLCKGEIPLEGNGLQKKGVFLNWRCWGDFQDKECVQKDAGLLVNLMWEVIGGVGRSGW